MARSSELSEIFDPGAFRVSVCVVLGAKAAAAGVVVTFAIPAVYVAPVCVSLLERSLGAARKSSRALASVAS